jgi:hypothetical protein
MYRNSFQIICTCLWLKPREKKVQINSTLNILIFFEPGQNIESRRNQTQYGVCALTLTNYLTERKYINTLIDNVNWG